MMLAGPATRCIEYLPTYLLGKRGSCLKVPKEMYHCPAIFRLSEIDYN